MAYMYVPHQWAEAPGYGPYYYAEVQPQSSIPLNILGPQVAPQQPAIPISSYSTLTGALDFSAVRSKDSRARRPSAHKTRSSASRHTNSQHEPSHSHGRTRSNSHQSTSKGARGVYNKTGGRSGPQYRFHTPTMSQPPPTGPTNHVLVPQLEYQDDAEQRRWGSDSHSRHPPIVFQSANIPEPGVRVGLVAHSAYHPAIDDPDDMVFASIGEREIRLWIVWPGYSSEPLKKRLKTQGGKMTRQLLLTLIATEVLEFTYGIYRRNVSSEPGHSQWQIGSRADEGRTIVGGELFITRLVHRGGSNWQPEIWAPRRF